jgi:quinolinate synthase
VDLSLDKLKLLMGRHPTAKLIAHPECPEHILMEADHVGSTASLLEFVQRDPGEAYIVATEAGILHRMRALVPRKRLIPAPSRVDNSCACSECPYMKLNTLEKVHRALLDLQPEIVLPAHVQAGAERALRRMLALE